MDLQLYDLCRQEPNLELMLNTTVTQAKANGRQIVSITAKRPSTNDRFEISAQIFVDCTGDGALATWPEPLFPWVANLKQSTPNLSLQYPAIKRPWAPRFYSKLDGTRTHALLPPPPWARSFSAESLKRRPFGRPGGDLNLEYGFWWLEWGGELDTIKDNEIIRDELLAALMGVWDFIKNHSEVDAENWALEWCGFLPGKRESRRLTGLHANGERPDAKQGFPGR